MSVSAVSGGCTTTGTTPPLAFLCWRSGAKDYFANKEQFEADFFKEFE